MGCGLTLYTDMFSRLVDLIAEYFFVFCNGVFCYKRLAFVAFPGSVMVRVLQ